MPIGPETFTFIAGPCAVESRDQTLEAAQMAKGAGATLLRGGAFKPRTSPYAFQGLGVEGLEILADVGAATGLPVVTEVVDARDVAVVAEHADMLQIGTRNMANVGLLQAVGTCGKPVLLKRGMNATIEEWLMAAEYVAQRGNLDIVLCERGIRTFETAYRNTLDISAVPAVQATSHLPVVVDPSHAAGRKDLVVPLARAAIAVGADGVLVDVHPHPELALCDGPQALDGSELRELATAVRRLPPVGRPGRRRVSHAGPPDLRRPSSAATIRVGGGDAMSSCTSCGHQLGVGRFCTNCGAPVDSSHPGRHPGQHARSPGASAPSDDWRTDTAERRLSQAAADPRTPPAAVAPPPPPRYPLFADEVRGLHAVRPAHHDHLRAAPRRRWPLPRTSRPSRRRSRAEYEHYEPTTTTTTRSGAARCSGSSRPRWCWSWSRRAGGSWSATTAPTRPPTTAAAASPPRDDRDQQPGRRRRRRPRLGQGAEDRAAQRGRQRRPGLLRRQQHARRRPRDRVAGARRRQPA